MLHEEDGSSVTLKPYDFAFIESWETHAVENTGDEMAIGLNVFAPSRSFDFWTDRERGVRQAPRTVGSIKCATR